jgi:hypothetical protein
MAKGILLYKDIKVCRKLHVSKMPSICSPRIQEIEIYSASVSYHDILGLVNGLNIITVVMLGVVDLDIVVGNIQKDLNNIIDA